MQLRRHPVTVLCALFVLQGVACLAIATRHEVVPNATRLSSVPLALGSWRTIREGSIDDDQRGVLHVDDYLVRDYVSPSGQPVGLFIAYFRSQRAGQTPHSPKNCLPGAGWTWSTSDILPLAIAGRARSVEINRYVVAKGDERAVVLYWYQSHGRIVANESSAALFTAWDALRWNRTDTALVRVVARNADDGLNFVQSFLPEFDRYNQAE